MRFLQFLMLVVLLLGSAALAQGEQTITFGETVEGVLSSEAPAVEYTFAGEQGQFVRITMLQVDSMDPYLRLLDAGGSVLAEDDDSAGSLNSRIGPYRLPANGTYTIVATSLGGSDTGAFTLSLDTATVQRIEYGQRMTGELSPDEPQAEYSFSAEAGDVVSIDLESDDFDAYLTLKSADTQATVANDDDSGSGRNARIGPLTLADSGDYTIAVSAFFSDPEGEYSLTLNPVELVPLAFDEALEVQISGGQARYFTFEGTAGQVVDVRVDSGNSLDTEVTLYGPGSMWLASVDDVDGQLDPALTNVILTETGPHFIAVQPNVIRDALTPVLVKLTESHVALLDSGPQTVQFGGGTTTQLLMFAGGAGEHVRLRILVDSPEAISPNIRVTQGGQELASVNTYTISDEISFGLVVPDDGPVIVELTDYSFFVDAALTVELERG